MFGPEEVKGLEFDGVVVVNPHDILGDDPRGARLLYVAMTRAVQELAFVTTAPPPPVLVCLKPPDLSASDCRGGISGRQNGEFRPVR